MSVSRVHHCIAQKRIVRGTLEPPATTKCKCRKFITLKAATQLVKDRDAQWAVTKRIYLTEMEPCGMCAGETEKWVSVCSRCNGKGTVPMTRDVSEHSNDIVLIGQDKAVYEKPKTPRTATVEEEHFELAYCDGLVKGIKPEPIPGLNNLMYLPRVWDRPNVARQRIEEYGEMITQARAFVGPAKNPTIADEPEDNQYYGEGPTHDWGWGAMRTCAFEDVAVIEDMPVKDHPSLEGQANFTASQEREVRLAKIMEELA